MNRDEFMRQVEYLLSDIPEEDKRDALDYYRDYLEEAGDKEQEALREFGSPERIAAIIRSDIRGDLKDGGEFTETGYTDERFREPRYQIVKRMDTAEKSPRRGNASENRSSGTDVRSEETVRKNSSGKKPGEEDKKGMTLIKAVVIIAVIILLSPVLLGVGGGVLGLLLSAMGTLAAAVIAVGAVTLILLVAAVFIGVYGIVTLFSDFVLGALCIGIALLLLSLGLLSLLLAVLFYGRFLPWFFRGCADLTNKIFRGKRRSMA